MKKPDNFRSACVEIASELVDVLISKQHDYGKGNIADFGELGVLVRANDKIERLKNLVKTGNTPSNESVDDSWLDLANYAIIALMLRRGYWELPLKDDE